MGYIGQNLEGRIFIKPIRPLYLDDLKSLVKEIDERGATKEGENIYETMTSIDIDNPKWITVLGDSLRNSDSDYEASELLTTDNWKRLE
jgi:hypothetical protein